MRSSQRTNLDGTKMWLRLVLCLLCFCCSSANLKAPISYNLTEERAYGTFVGNVISDGGLRDKHDSSTLESLRFSLLEPDSAARGLFAIDEVTGVLRVAQRVDRDELCPSAPSCVLALDVQVMPLDHFEIVKVAINVLDLNDHVPAFPADTIIRKLSEASVVGTALSIPLPADPDSPRYGVHHYKLISSSNTFELQVPEDPESLEDIYLVLVRPLDREQQDAYMVQLVAFDGGDPAQWGSVMVNITVIDVNDNTPAFRREAYETTVPENSPVGTMVLRVVAVDEDTGEQGRVVYAFSQKTLAAHRNTFRINATTGEITAVGLLDYEATDEYKLNVIARDNSTQALSSQTLVTIRVLDENDHPPQIKLNPANASHLVISESHPPGEFVAHISVVDSDAGDNGQFNCTLRSEFFSLLKLYETEFKLVTTTALDREKHDTFLLSVVCTDTGAPPLRSRQDVLIQVEDVNDNAPVFDEDQYEVSLAEGSPAGSTVSQLRAIDADVGNNGAVSYHLLDDTAGLFHIDPTTGSIVSLAVLDHEMLAQVNVTVVAEDAGIPTLVSSVLVTINVDDVDDEPLRFPLERYTFSVPENSGANSSVGNVEATDVDTANLTVTYSFQNEGNISMRPFSINSETGEITLTGDVDYELQKAYNLTVVASAYGDQSNYATCRLSIIVGDFNDHMPEFVFPNPDNYTVDAGNQVDAGQVITQVVVSDADSGLNGRISFYIKEGNGSEYFSIDRDTGVIVAEERLNALGSMYALAIVAYDNGEPKLTSEASLEIHIREPASLTSLAGGSQTIIIVVACVSGVLAVVLVVAIVLIIRRQCCGGRRRNRRNVIVKFSSENPLCTSSVTSEDDRKGDSFSSHDSGNESASSGGKEAESRGSGSCSPGSSSSLGGQAGDVDDCGIGQGPVVAAVENNRPLFLQIPTSEGNMLNTVRLEKDSSSSSQSDGYLQIDMTPDPCFYTEGSQWPQSSGLLLQPVSVEEMHRQLYPGVHRSHSYLGAVSPSPLPHHARPRRHASFLSAHNKLANPSHLYGPGYCAPVSAECGGRMGEHAPSFAPDPQGRPACAGQYYQRGNHPDINLVCPPSNCLTNESTPHLRQCQPGQVQSASPQDYWDIPVFELQSEGAKNHMGSLPRRTHNPSCAEDFKAPETSILKDSSGSTECSGSSQARTNKHGNHVRFTLPEEEGPEIADQTVITLAPQPSIPGKRVFLCSEV